ncbi:MAG: adenylate/guanylate cyclase domain-containing protein [Spirochaetota bacterium]
MTVRIRHTADEILEQKERRGLMITTSVRLVFLAILIIGHTFTFQHAGEIISVSLISGAASAVSLWILYALKTRTTVTGAGYAGVFLDSAILALLPVIWQLSIGGNSLPPAYMTKTLFTAISFMMIMIHTLSLHPRYPLIIGFASALINAGILLFAALDPRTVFSTTIIDIARPEVIVIGFQISVILAALITGGIASFITYISRKTVYEAVSLEQANSQLSAYFSPEVAETIAAHHDFMLPGGVTQNVAVLFADIRSFTAISESNSPETVLRLLSEYHETMVDIIFSHGGTLDKFIGDGIMATFGTPFTKPDDIERALRAGIAMRNALPSLNGRLLSQGLSSIQIGIGIHYGSVIAGNIGSRSRLEYTVIGDTVNTASRVESACKAAGENLLFTQAIREAASQEFIIRHVGRFELKGKTEPVDLFTAD